MTIWTTFWSRQSAHVFTILVLAFLWQLPGHAETVKFGVNLPLSGALTPFGKSTLDGIQLRVNQINQAGGVNGHNLELVVEDNKGDKAQCISVYKKLTGIANVAAVIGPITSTNALAIANQASQAKTPTISPTATNDKVAPKSPYMFRACFNDSFQGRVIANYAIRNRQLLKAATMVDLGSDYSKGLAQSFSDVFTREGGAIVAQESYQQKDTEFGAQLAKIKAAGAQLVFVPGYPPEVPLIVKQAGVIGLDAQFCGADGWDHESVIENSGDKIIGSFIVGAFSAEDTRAAVQQFVATMGANAGTFEALGYDSVSLLAEALKTGIDRESIRSGLLAIKNFEAVTGAITIKESGDAEKSAVILTIVKEGDRYIKKYQATVQP